MRCLWGSGANCPLRLSLPRARSVVFFCSGRGGYVKSIGNHKVGLRTLETGTPASAAYLRTVCNVEPQADGVKFQLRANDGGLMTNFDGSRRVNTDPKSTAGTFTLTQGTSGGYWSIRDANGMYFNGDGVSGGGENFCGWNEAGGSSDYKVYFPEVKDAKLIKTTFFCMNRATMSPIRTADGDDLILSGKFLTGETVTFPTDDALHYYDLVQYEDGEGELHPASEPCVLPGDAEDEQDFILYYDPWPTVIIECVVGEGEDARVFYTKTVRVAKGDILPLPTKAEIGRGYDLLSTEYDNYVVQGDEVITLRYEAVDPLPRESDDHSRRQAGTRDTVLLHQHGRPLSAGHTLQSQPAHRGCRPHRQDDTHVGLRQGRGRQQRHRLQPHPGCKQGHDRSGHHQ